MQLKYMRKLMEVAKELDVAAFSKIKSETAAGCAAGGGGGGKPQKGFIVPPRYPHSLFGYGAAILGTG